MCCDKAHVGQLAVVKQNAAAGTANSNHSDNPSVAIIAVATKINQHQEEADLDVSKLALQIACR